MAQGIKENFIKAIEATGHPLAPIILQELYAACNKLGPVLVSSAKCEETQAHAERLLKNYPMTNDDYARDPNFILALSSLLANSLVEYGRAL